ncbi:MAG: hypothetical protein ACYTHJ_13830 [Planctomycetota bacterium]
MAPSSVATGDTAQATGESPAKSPGTDPKNAAMAAAVLDGYVEAIGGKTAWAKIRNRKSTGVYELPSQQTIYEMTIVDARPGKRHSLFVPGIPSKPTESATDGKKSWSKMGYGPAVEQDAEKTAASTEAAIFDRFIDWRTYFPQVEHAGKEPVDGLLCDKIIMTPRTGGLPLTRFFEEKTHLLIQSVELFSEDDQLYTVKYSDYREVDGIKYPHLWKISYMFNLRYKVYQQIEHNVELRPDEFDMPPYPDPRYPEYQGADD